MLNKLKSTNDYVLRCLLIATSFLLHGRILFSTSVQWIIKVVIERDCVLGGVVSARDQSTGSLLPQRGQRMFPWNCIIHSIPFFFFLQY